MAAVTNKSGGEGKLCNNQIEGAVYGFSSVLTASFPKAGGYLEHLPRRKHVRSAHTHFQNACSAFGTPIYENHTTRRNTGAKQHDRFPRLLTCMCIYYIHVHNYADVFPYNTHRFDKILQATGCSMKLSLHLVFHKLPRFHRLTGRCIENCAALQDPVAVRLCGTCELQAYGGMVPGAFLISLLLGTNQAPAPET